MADFDVAVVGAGAVGLACASTLARTGYRVVVLERHGRPGQETSTRNSGVIHAGIYYPPDSLKARLCVEGRELLYARCIRYGIAHRKLGKLIVATSSDEAQELEQIRARAVENGAGDVTLLEGSAALRLEPHLSVVAALRSPETGIVDVHGVLESYRYEAREAGAEMAFATEVRGLRRVASRWDVQACTRAREEFSVSARWVVNAAGLGAVQLAALAGVDVDAREYRYHLCKGDYFALAARWRGAIRHLVYPVPVHAGLGIHLTLDLAGTLMAGPDATYLDAKASGQLDYDVEASKADAFATAIGRYLPGVRASDLSPAYAGIRPKLQGPESAFRDFAIEHELRCGAPGLIDLIGIESPGLTASEAIARRVARLMQGDAHTNG